MFKEFKEFAMRGNVIDMAVGIIIGAAFGKIVSAFVADVLMPPIGLLLGKVVFSNLFVNLNGQSFPSVVAAKAAGDATLDYGIFFGFGYRLSDRGLCDLPVDQAGQPAHAQKGRGRVGAGGRRVPARPCANPDQGDPLCALRVS